MAQVSMNEDSPYLAKDGAVSELGQPTSQQDSAAAVGTQRAQAEQQQRPAPPVDHQQPAPSYEAPPAAAGGDQVSDRGLHFGGHKEPSSQADPNFGTRHPLEATQDVNIGHGHEPFEQLKPGGHSQEPIEQKRPGVVGKIKDAITGQKPGQGTATGNATAGSLVPGEDDYAGKTGHQSGWPQPVAPPGMSTTGAPPSAGHHGYDEKPAVAQHGYGENPAAAHGYLEKPSATQHGYKPQDGYEARPGAELASSAVPGYGDKPPATHHGYDKPQHGYDGRPGAENYGDKPPTEYYGHDEKPAAGYDKPQGGYYGSGAPEDKYTTPVQTEEKYTSSSVPTGSSTVSPHSQAPISTPAEPEARHDVPSPTNAPAAEYTDPHGNVHPEGPRDDNVKKEGLMSKLMDKLHISGKKHKHNKHGAEPTTPLWIMQ